MSNVIAGTANITSPRQSNFVEGLMGGGGKDDKIVSSNPGETGFKFPLDPADLSKGNLSLPTEEKTIFQWKYDSEAMTLSE